MEIQIRSYEDIDSTNAEAKRLAKRGAPEGILVVAEAQTAGRGRGGHRWDSPPGGSIYMSILLRPKFEPEIAPMLTLLMANSVADAVLECTGLEVRIKWPNDLVLHGKKICGILTEMEVMQNKIQNVVIGVGINVNMKEFSEEIQDTATSLLLEGGKTVDREKLIASAGRHFAADYDQFCKDRDLRSFQKHYNEMLINRGREVQILGEKESYRGLAEGINEAGELLVTREDGRKETVRAGEVSVRGVYGYV